MPTVRVNTKRKLVHAVMSIVVVGVRPPTEAHRIQDRELRDPC
jgi:hypothetical protein